MELDLLDKRILSELDNNSRESLNKIAKKLRVNRNVVLYRVERLKKFGIIRGYYTEINTLNLGLMSFRLFLKLSNYTKEQFEELNKYLENQKSIIWYFRVIGKWDLDLVFVSKDIFEFDKFKEELFLKFNSILEDSNISILTQINHLSKDYILDKKRKETELKLLEKEDGFFDLDDKDVFLLKLLSNNANMSILDLKNELDLSINTINKRIRNLIKNKVIFGFRIFVDTKKLGYDYYKLHLNFRNYSKKDISEFNNYLISKNFIIYIDKYLGGCDLEIEMHLKSENYYIDFITNLKEKFGYMIKDSYLLKFYEEKIFRYLPEDF